MQHFLRSFFSLLVAVVSVAAPAFAQDSRPNILLVLFDDVGFTTIDGNLVTGQNQNSGYETAHRILEKLATEKN